MIDECNYIPLKDVLHILIRVRIQCQSDGAAHGTAHLRGQTFLHARQTSPGPVIKVRIEIPESVLLYLVASIGCKTVYSERIHDTLDGNGYQ